MEKRIEKLENHFDQMQQALYEVLANVKAINQNITKAIDMEEKVIRLDERQKVNEKRLANCETARDKMKTDFYKELEKIKEDSAKTKNKLAMYSGAILIISLFVPSLIKFLIK